MHRDRAAGSEHQGPQGASAVGLQPQIEVEDIRQIPILMPIFEETKEVRHDSLGIAKSLFSQYLRTDDPGWILEYVDDNIKLGSKSGSAMVHDLLDFLGSQHQITDRLKMLEQSISQ